MAQALLFVIGLVFFANKKDGSIIATANKINIYAATLFILQLK